MQSNPRVPFQLSSQRRKLAPPNGKPLIVHVVVNVEHWQFDQPMPRMIMAETCLWFPVWLDSSYDSSVVLLQFPLSIGGLM